VVDVARATRRRDAVIRALLSAGLTAAQVEAGDIVGADAPGAARGLVVLPPAER